MTVTAGEECMRRRTFLAVTGSMAVAGCGSSDDGNGNGGGDTPTATDEQNDPGGGETTAGEGTATEQQNAEYVNQADGQVQLAFGETARVENGVEVTAHGVSLEESAGGEEPRERDLFAFLQMEAVNTSEEEQRLPAATDPDLYLLYGDQQVEPTFRSAAFSDSEYQQYEGGDVQGGVRREGSILFEVDEGFEGEIDFLWQDDYFVAENVDGSIDVRWSQG